MVDETSFLVTKCEIINRLGSVSVIQPYVINSYFSLFNICFNHYAPFLASLKVDETSFLVTKCEIINRLGSVSVIQPYVINSYFSLFNICFNYYAPFLASLR